MLTTEDKDRIARALFTAMEIRDFSIIENDLNEEIRFDFPGAGLLEGRKRVLLFMKAMLRRYRSLTFDISDCVIQDTRACVIWTNRGEYLDGSPYANSGITLVHFDDRGIVFLSDYFKDTGFAKTT